MCEPITSLLIDPHMTRPFECFEEGEFVRVDGACYPNLDFAFPVANLFNGYPGIAEAFRVEVDRNLRRLLDPIEARNDFNFLARSWNVGPVRELVAQSLRAHGQDR